MSAPSQWVIGELEGLSVGAALRRSARLYPDMPFLKSDEATLAFCEFDQRVDQLASGLAGLVIGHGDHVAVWLNNSIEWIQTFFACARIGAVVVPINTRYTATEAGHLLSQSDAKLLVMTRRIWGNDYLAQLERVAPSLAAHQHGVLQLDELPMLRHLVLVGEGGPPGSERFEALAAVPAAAQLAQWETRVKPSDTLLIGYTSGTTGKPKGAMHNHAVIKQATRVGLACALQPGGSVLGHMPLYHVAGLYMGLVPALTLGACYVVMPQWDTSQALDLIEREKITLFGGIPTHFVDMVNHPSIASRDLSSMRIAWMGGAPVMRATYDRFKRALGLQHLLSTYGMTENTISTTFNRLTDPAEDASENRAPVLANCEVRIVDPFGARPLATGEIGEVWCRGETVMMGYYKNPEATRATITEDGWLRTGDLGFFDARGFLSLTGRLKEMYKSGGTNVYPAEVEQHLAAHPAVRMVAVVAVPDERLGEVGFAYVQTHEGAGLTLAQLRAHCKGTLADYKIPRYLAMVPELPRTSTGKIQRGALADMARSEIAKQQEHTQGR